MPAEHHIRNPFELALQQLTLAANELGHAAAAPPHAHRPTAVKVQRLSVADLRRAVREGVADLGAARADVLFIGLIYPLAGLVLARLAFNYDLLPMIFPLASGFAILGPLAAVGLYEISRRREAGEPVSVRTALGVLASPNLGSILGMGALLVLLFAVWLITAWAIYQATLGPTPPASPAAFAHAVFATPAGWTMTAVGIGVGFVFAAAAFAISVVSFPMLLDRDVGMGQAITTSLHVVRANPTTMALWGAFVAVSLVAASIPALVGLIVVVPVLGHATWRLYRAAVADA